MSIGKDLGGVEDLLFGLGTRIQLRRGQEVTITEINAEHIPYSLTRTVVDQFVWVDSKFDQMDNFVDLIGDALLTKSDKVVGATNGNLAALDSEGNLVDSGIATVGSGGMNVVYPPVEDNLVAMNSLGNSKDSGIALATVVVEDRTVTAEDNAIDFGGLTKNYEITATAGVITALNVTAEKEGTILIHSADLITGWGIEFKFKTVPTDLLGDEAFGYFIEDANNIWIGRVQ